MFFFHTVTLCVYFGAGGGEILNFDVVPLLKMILDLSNNFIKGKKSKVSTSLPSSLLPHHPGDKGQNSYT